MESTPAESGLTVFALTRAWDERIETLERYRDLGLGGRAARSLIPHMQLTGRVRVWGPLESNIGSRALAARPGFLEAGGVAVFTEA